MEKPYKYDEWLDNFTCYALSEGISLELYILRSFYAVTEQHIKDTQSHAGKGHLINSMLYVQYYIESKEAPKLTNEQIEEIFGEK